MKIKIMKFFKKLITPIRWIVGLTLLIPIFIMLIAVSLLMLIVLIYSILINIIIPGNRSLIKPLINKILIKK